MIRPLCFLLSFISIACAQEQPNPLSGPSISPAQLGIAATVTPPSVWVLDPSQTWAQFGTIDPATHLFMSTPAGVNSSGNVSPTADNAYSLGSASNRWANGYFVNETLSGAQTWAGSGQFWAQNGADIHRMNDRLFVGGATVNDGAYPNVTKDWLSTLQVGWGLPIGYTTGSMFNSLTSSAASSEYGIVGAGQTINATAAQPAIGVLGFGLANNTTYNTTAWGLYSEGHLVNGTGSAEAAELEAVAHIASLAPTPNGQGNVNGLQDGCGGGYTAGFTQQNCSTAIQIVSNGAQFKAGINILAGSLVASAPAVMLPVGNGVYFYDAGGHAFGITSTFTANDSGSIILADNGIEVSTNFFPTADNADLLGLPTLRWSNFYTVNAIANQYQAVAGAPVASACGTSPSVTAGSGPNVGELVFGTGTVTACSVTFAAAYPANGFCTVTPEQSMGATNWWLSARSKTGFTITLSVSTPSAKFTYGCMGN